MRDREPVGPHPWRPARSFRTRMVTATFLGVILSLGLCLVLAPGETHPGFVSMATPRGPTARRASKIRSHGLRRVAGGKGSQVRPAAARLAGGTILLAFERIITAQRRRVYVQRRRPGRGWSWARALPLARGDYTQRDPTLLVRSGNQVLLYVQVDDLRRMRASIRVHVSRGDSLRWQSRGRLGLRLSGGGARAGAPASPRPRGSLGGGHPSARHGVAHPRLALTQPFAALDRAGGVLLTVTRRFAGSRDGCHLARSPDGLRFGPLRRIGPGRRCRVVATGPGQLLLTYQSRARRRKRWRAFSRTSSDGGKTWTSPRPISALISSSDAHPVPGSPGKLRILFVVSTPVGSAVGLVTSTPSGRRERRLTLPGRRRDIAPFGLPDGKDLLVFFAREIHPLDFDVLSLKTLAP